MPGSIISNSPDSPFDSIRHFDEYGHEFWKARELMKLLGYVKFQRFQDAVQRASLSLNRMGESEASHIKHLPGSVSGNGRTGDDYKLSRYACYLIAMNGDVRKVEIASAQSYFAIKTREAETVISAQSDRIRELELENENFRLKSYYMDRRDAIQKIHGVEMLALLDGRPDAVVSKREILTESIICKDGRTVSFIGKSLAQLGKELGFKSGKEFEKWLESVGRGDLISQGMRAVQSDYIAEEHIDEIRRLWIEKRSALGRQLLIGE